MKVCLLMLLLSVLPDCFSKVQELKVNVDFPGDDVLQIYSPDVYHCQLACTQHHSCNFFTFLRSDWSRDDRKFYCYLKHTDSETPSVVTNLIGVTSGFSLSRKDYKTFSCLPSKYQDVDFPGSDYSKLTSHSYDECQKQCTSDPNCQLFSFTTDKFQHSEYRTMCFLKYSWTIPIPPVLVHTAGYVSGFSDLLSKAEGAKAECKEDTQADTDFPGNDFETVPAVSPQHCQFLCSKHPHCTHFSYLASSVQSSEPGLSMRCYLKYKDDVSQVQPFKKGGVYSGYPTRDCEASNVWAATRYESLDFNGYDIREFTTSKSEICRDICTTDPDCQFYSFSINRRKCKIKKVLTLPRPEKVVHIDGVVSGFSLRDCADDLKIYSECGKVNEETPRIFGGFAALAGDWPWQVSLSRDSKHFCGGSIINSRWIITAAHCLARPYSQIVVRTGLTKLSENGTEYALETAIVHPEYDEDSFLNDIALIKTRKPVAFDDYTKPVCLMGATNEAKFIGRNCTVTGWGRLKSGSYPDVLQEAQVPLLTAEQCATILSEEDLEPNKILSTNLCAGFRQGGIDTCDGDSGGPLVCEDANESTWYLAGVTSWGMDCGKPDRPGVYTRIMQYLPWIKSVITNEG